jgi:hypothetical protein
MATGADLAERVLAIVQDDSFDEDAVLVHFNACAKKIAERYILPGLDTEGTVVTAIDSWSVAAPTNFQRNLYFAAGPNGKQLSILNSRQEMLAFTGNNPAKTGSRVEAIALVGDRILYAPIVPDAAQTLSIFYQRKPTVILDSTEINLLPGFTEEQDDMMVNFACWKIYSSIEQGLEGAKVDTGYYSALFMGAFDQLRLSFREGISLPPPRTVSMNSSW